MMLGLRRSSILCAVMAFFHSSSTRPGGAQAMPQCSHQEFLSNLQGGPDGTLREVGGRYYLIGSKLATWYQSRNICRNLRANSDLVVFDADVNEDAFTDDLLSDSKRDRGYWIGLRRRRKSMGFYWLDQDHDISHDMWHRFSNGAPAQPDKNGCVAKSGWWWQWQADRCLNHRYFICSLDIHKYNERFSSVQKITRSESTLNLTYHTNFELSCGAFVHGEDSLSLQLSSQDNTKPTIITHGGETGMEKFDDLHAYSDIGYYRNEVKGRSFCAQYKTLTLSGRVTRNLDGVKVSCCIHGNCADTGGPFSLIYPHLTPEQQISYIVGAGLTTSVEVTCAANVGSGGVMTLKLCTKDGVNNIWRVSEDQKVDEHFNGPALPVRVFVEVEQSEGPRINLRLKFPLEHNLRGAVVRCHSARVTSLDGCDDDDDDDNDDGEFATAGQINEPIHADGTNNCSEAEHTKSIPGDTDGDIITVKGESFFLSTTTKNWFDASDACKALHAHSDLVTFDLGVQDSWFTDDILDVTKREQGYWIGLRRLTDSTKNFHWSGKNKSMSESQRRYFTGGVPQPASRGKKCVAKMQQKWKWSALECFSQRYYICHINSETYYNRFRNMTILEIESGSFAHQYSAMVTVSCKAFTVEGDDMYMAVSPFQGHSRYEIRVDESMRTPYLTTEGTTRYLYTTGKGGAVCSRFDVLRISVNITETTEIICCVRNTCLYPESKFTVTYPRGNPELEINYDESPLPMMEVKCAAYVGGEGHLTVRICSESDHHKQTWLVNSSGSILTEKDEGFRINNLHAQVDNVLAKGPIITLSMSLKSTEALKNAVVVCYSEDATAVPICTKQSREGVARIIIEPPTIEASSHQTTRGQVQSRIKDSPLLRISALTKRHYRPGTPKLEVFYDEHPSPQLPLITTIKCAAPVGDDGYLTVRICSEDNYHTQTWLVNTSGSILTENDESLVIVDIGARVGNGLWRGPEITLSISLNTTDVLMYAVVVCYSEDSTLLPICIKEHRAGVALEILKPPSGELTNGLSVLPIFFPTRDPRWNRFRSLPPTRLGPGPGVTPDPRRDPNRSIPPTRLGPGPGVTPDPRRDRYRSIPPTRLAPAAGPPEVDHRGAPIFLPTRPPPMPITIRGPTYPGTPKLEIYYETSFLNTSLIAIIKCASLVGDEGRLTFKICTENNHTQTWLVNTEKVLITLPEKDFNFSITNVSIEVEDVLKEGPKIKLSMSLNTTDLNNAVVVCYSKNANTGPSCINESRDGAAREKMEMPAGPKVRKSSEAEDKPEVHPYLLPLIASAALGVTALGGAILVGVNMMSLRSPPRTNTQPTATLPKLNSTLDTSPTGKSTGWTPPDPSSFTMTTDLSSGAWISAMSDVDSGVVSGGATISGSSYRNVSLRSMMTGISRK